MKKVVSFIIILFFVILPIQHSMAEVPIFLSSNEESLKKSYEYIIITDSSLSHEFQRLIDYKSQFISSKLVTLDYIFQELSLYGRDNQEKIRSFISYAHQEWNTKFVLLGGDTSIIPHRELYAEMTDWQGRSIQSNIPSDMYYGCLNGTWDDDSDFIFGEQEKNSIADEAIWHAEVFIGRAPVKNSFEASIFINKVISFETSEKPKSIQLHQSGLNPENNPSSSRIIENCAKWIPKEEYTIERFYSIFQDVTVDKWVKSFNDGKLIVQHAGNGNTYQYDLDNINNNEVWTIQDISKLKNTFYPVHTSLACHSGDFTSDGSIAEKMLLHPTGGISAAIFNSDFGAVGNENAHSYSGEFLERQFYEIFVNDTKHLGEITQKSKEYFADLSVQDPKYRWVYYSINLLGDPETPILGKREYGSSSIFSVNNEFSELTSGWNITRFNSIQSAIDNVDEGGTILVYSGDYHENITISKSVYLYGTNRNYQNNDPYSRLTRIIGSGNGNVITVNANDVYIDGFIITNGGPNHAGVYLNNVTNVHFYRNQIVQNLGNGVKINSSNFCRIYYCSISFNWKNAVVLHDSHFNHLEGLIVAYNQKDGLILFHSNNNQIVGQSSSWQSPVDFYGSRIFHKNQNLNLKNPNDLKKFIRIFTEDYSKDYLERLFYLPVSPPTETDNLITTDYFYVINNRKGLNLDTSYNNTLKNLWIENRNEGIGIGIFNSSMYPNYIISNFIYKNKIGIKVVNSSVKSLFLNNLYNNDVSISLSNCSGILTSDQGKISFFIGGNIAFNEKSPFSRFKWMFLDETNNVIFIDAISLALATGYVFTCSLLTISNIISKFYPLQTITTILSLFLIITTFSPFILKYIKTIQPPPVFTFN